ncbi:MAG: enoyl-CoA hydratase-related protein [Epibacterium sp.]|nr:enoyl-CoA hydratase-related protein [Epibacterium sp.]
MKSLDLTIENKIAHVQFNRPAELNTMNRDFWLEFPKVIGQINADASARVIVLFSTGKHFCAGMELGVFSDPNLLRHDADLGRKQENVRHVVTWLQEAFNKLETARMPVLAAVQGGCIGGAVDMVSACDSRYCTEDAFFCIEETKIGMTADLCKLQRLPHLIPQGLMRELAYTGRRLPAAEAKECGLVNRIILIKRRCCPVSWRLLPRLQPARLWR